MKYTEFVPVKLEEGIYTFAIPVDPCPSCGTPTLRPDLSHNSIFWDQAQAAGIRRSFEYTNAGGKVICEVCYSQFVKEKFECDHCNQVWPKSEIQFEFNGNGTGYLCKNCYNTLTAAQWDEAFEDIKATYQYND